MYRTSKRTLLVKVQKFRRNWDWMGGGGGLGLICSVEKYLQVFRLYHPLIYTT